MTKENPIIAMQPDKLRENGGIVFDLDSFARHCATAPPAAPVADMPAPPDAPPTQDAPQGVFPVQPVHAGWYPAEKSAAPIPRMAGCLAPTGAQATLQNGIAITYFACGSGSGSYRTSYQTSWATSGSGSFWYGSGSGSFVFGSDIYFIGGYGLELI